MTRAAAFAQQDAPQSLSSIDVSDPQLYQDDGLAAVFRAAAARGAGAPLRREPLRPVLVGLALQRHHAVEVEPRGVTPSSIGGIQMEDQPRGLQRPSFIRMDPPKHDEQRKVVGPIVAPANLEQL